MKFHFYVRRLFGFYNRQNQWCLVLLLFCLITLNAATVYSQNLVPNPSFEEYDVCPGDFSKAAYEFRVKYWQSANLGTPDNFNDCSNGEADVPYNWAGVSQPYQGMGYVGIYLWMNTNNNYREYLQCKLLDPMLKDSLYEIEFHYKLSSYSMYSVDRIGLLLTDSLVYEQHDQVISVSPTISMIQDSALTKETGYWETARQEYRAKSSERYLTIGNFFDNKTTHHYFIRFNPVQQIMLEKSAYYYIDEVNVTPLFNTRRNQITEIITEFDEDQTVLDRDYILRHIQFEFDQSILQSSSFAELDGVVSWLMKNPSVRITLSGHTDDQGSDQYNLTLSINRAEAVANYFVRKGISAERIETSGFGKSKPIMHVVTEEARQLNRRVEIIFSE